MGKLTWREGLLLSGQQQNESQNHSNCKGKLKTKQNTIQRDHVGAIEPCLCCTLEFPLHMTYLGGTVENGGRLLGKDHPVPCHGLRIFIEQPFKGCPGPPHCFIVWRIENQCQAYSLVFGKECLGS